jgi:hypothetical protein
VLRLVEDSVLRELSAQAAMRSLGLSERVLRGGSAYLLLIEPFRHLIVYPALMRQLERSWRAREPRSVDPVG